MSLAQRSTYTLYKVMFDGYFLTSYTCSLN